MNLEQYNGLVHHIARRVHKFDTALYDHDDLYAVGYLGLLDAAKRFDPAKGVKFITFAAPRVRGAIIDEMRRMNHYHHRRELRMEYIEALRDEDDRLLLEPADPDLNPLDKAILKDQRRELMKNIANLSEMERQVIFMYYYGNFDMKGIAKVLNRTESRVSQIHSKAIKRLRNRMARHKDDFVN
jgi:RNA polymerase sigma factor for flagellar operon FliA